jgi:hypothetical protein
VGLVDLVGHVDFYLLDQEIAMVVEVVVVVYIL